MYLRANFYALVAALAFFVLLAWACFVDHLPLVLLWFYLALSAMALLVYGWDKLAAVFRWRRTPEIVLHAYALLGGWPGAMFAQQFFRHKSSKRSFRREFWFTVVLNLVALSFLFCPHGEPVTRWMRSLSLPL